MHDQIRAAELFNGLSAGRVQRLAAIGRVLTLRSGEYLFLLGDSAQYASVVTSGLVDLCCPISFGGVVKDITVEAAGPGKTVGWSALVKPFRFTLSARAARASEVIAFARPELLQVFAGDPEIERVVLGRVSELMANRLTMFQALWMRELLRTFSPGGQGSTA
ncbi:MAG: Crp/Fnr family transcriptional regulator [Acidobacteria bacterium]|nr:Crp/Fnr family transcriptional regulator [Acidobacteriota bacterium]